jgi:hypothetical protein
MTAVTRPFPPPLAATRWTLDVSESRVAFVPTHAALDVVACLRRAA